jgi:hypothetical protein
LRDFKDKPAPSSRRALDGRPKTVRFQTMKVLSVSNAKSKPGRAIDQVIKTREPIVIPRGENFNWPSRMKFWRNMNPPPKN